MSLRCTQICPWNVHKYVSQISANMLLKSMQICPSSTCYVCSLKKHAFSLSLTLSLILSLALFLSLFLSLPVYLSHTHAQTHTHKNAHTHRSARATRWTKDPSKPSSSGRRYVFLVFFGSFCRCFVVGFFFRYHKVRPERRSKFYPWVAGLFSQKSC